jgi:hypothetical protein
VPGVRRSLIAVWLAAVALLGFRWLSPLAGFYERAILSDGLIAVAVALWLVDIVRGRRPRLQAWHAWLGAYVVAVTVSALAAPDRADAARVVLLVSELALFAVVSADLARDPRIRRALAWTVLAAVGVTAALAVVALTLFYLGQTTALIGPYGEQFAPSARYARVTAGFASPPLLASWCIVASAILALRGTLPDRLRIAGQIALAVLVVATFSRAALAFAAAIAIRWAAGQRTRTRVRAAAAVVAGALAVVAALPVGRLQLDPTRPSTISYQVPDPGNRREAIATSWDTLAANPLRGSGPGTYPGLNRGQPFRAHLTPLNVAATTGLPALLILTGMFVSLWRGRSRPTDVAVWSGMAGLAVDGLAQDIEHFRHVWLLIGLAGATTAAAPARGGGSSGCKHGVRPEAQPET